MTASKGTKPTIGDEAWEVEWCKTVFVEDDGVTGDPDRNVNLCRTFPTYEAALAFGRKVWPKSQTGMVFITPMRFAPYEDGDEARYPHVGFWEHTADSKVLSDDTGVPE